MDGLRLDNTDVGYLCLFLLAATASGYLLSVPGKSRGTAWLSGTAVAVAAFIGVRLATSLALKSLDLAGLGFGLPVLLTLDVLGLAVSATAAVGFAYTFLGAPHPGEARGVLRTLIATDVLLLGALLVTGVTDAVSPRGVTMGALGVTVLGYLWASAVLARKAWRTSREEPETRVATASPEGQSGLVRARPLSSARRVRALRGFALVMPLGAAVGAATYAAKFSGGGEMLVWLTLLVLLLGTLALFVSYAPEPTSLQAKVVVFVLAAALTALSGAVGLGNRPDDLARSSGVEAPEREAVWLRRTPGGGYRVQPAGLALGAPGTSLPTPNFWTGASVDLGFDFPLGDTTWRRLEVFPSGFVRFTGGPDVPVAEAPLIAPLYAPPSPDAWEMDRVYLRRDSGRVALTWLAVTSAAAEAHATFQLVLDATGDVTMRYGDAGYVRSLVRGVLPRGSGADPERLTRAGSLPTEIPPSGIVQTAAPATDAHASRRLLPWVWLVLGTTLGCLLGLPLLLRASVTRPLGRLLEGVRQVQAGDLSAEVEVAAPDEVGRLTAHFNRMTGALRRSQDELRAYAATLETRVAERTAELSEEKAALARTLDELRRTQARMVQQEKLASLGRLTQGIAHEIKNPLNFVNNFASLSEELVAELQEDAASDPELRLADVSDTLEMLAGNAARVHEHGKRADAIVAGMMEHAQGGAESLQTVEVNALVETHVARTVDAWTGAAVEVERAYAADAGTVNVAPHELGRVVSNLVANALDAAAEQAGEAPPHVRIVTRRDGDGVHITVEDNGAGLDAEAQSRAFEPFYTTKPTGQGHVGLGLSLAQDVVQSHGGAVAVESTPAQGATFTVTLPVPDAPPVLAPPTEAGPAS